MTDKLRLVFSSTTISAGFAIFCMFFGAGNVIFPLSLGQNIGEPINYALFGLILTAIGAPLLGLFGTILFEGDCKGFFSRIGEIPAYLLVIMVISIIGPFGAMPRCMTVAHTALLPYFPDLSMFSFSLIAGFFVVLCVWKRSLIIPILGMVLSPLLLISLIIIIIKGFLTSQDPIATSFTPMTAFVEGVNVGYDTMDLLASVFFAVVIWDLLKEKFSMKGQVLSPKSLAPMCFMASMIGGFLLAIIYIGLSKVAAENMQAMAGIEQKALLSHIAIYILGAKFAFIANAALALACLTTVMSLAATIADVILVEFRDSRVGNGRELNYDALVIIIMVITIIFSNLGFEKLMSYLHPIVALCYPALIVLAVCNILYKLFGFPWVKFPVYATFMVALCHRGYIYFLA